MPHLDSEIELHRPGLQAFEKVPVQGPQWRDVDEGNALTALVLNHFVNEGKKCRLCLAGPCGSYHQNILAPGNQGNGFSLGWRGPRNSCLLKETLRGRREESERFHGQAISPKRKEQ